MSTQPKDLVTITDAQGAILDDIARNGHPTFGIRANTGGAIHRMIERMRRKYGFLVNRWDLTDTGREALSIYRARMARRIARMTR